MVGLGFAFGLGLLVFDSGCGCFVWFELLVV